MLADGTRELTEDDLWALQVPPDMQLSVIDAPFKIMLPYSHHNSHSRPGPNLGGAQKYMDWPKLMILSLNAFVDFMAG